MSGGRRSVNAQAVSYAANGLKVDRVGRIILDLPAQSVDLHVYRSLSYLGIVQVGVAYVCLTAGLRRVPALEASILLLGDPALNPLWVWLAHGERPGRWGLAGGAVILLATAVRTWASARPPAPVATAVPD